MPTGRPKITLNDLPPSWEEDMISLSKQGASELEIRINALNGLHHETWTRLINEEPMFSETVKICRANCQIWWEKLGRDMSAGGDGNATPWIFNMKNRFNWRDRQDIVTEDRTPKLSDEELKQLAHARIGGLLRGLGVEGDAVDFNSFSDSQYLIRCEPHEDASCCPAEEAALCFLVSCSGHASMNGLSCLPSNTIS